MSCWCRALLALVFGWFAFRSRIKGVYFSIVTQALTYAATLLFFRNATGSAATTASPTSSASWAGRSHDPARAPRSTCVRGSRCWATYVLCRYVVTSRLGRVLTAVRDAELKDALLRLRTTHYKLFVWTLSAMLCGLAGALYVPQVGIINPSEMQPSNSIEMAIWVAVGGRGSLVGAVSAPGSSPAARAG